MGIINEEAVRQFVAGDVEALQALVGAYLQQAPLLASNLVQAAALRPEALQRELVRLRGACRLLFAEAALAALDRVEAALEAGSPSRRSALKLLVRELARLEQALHALRAPLERELGWKVVP